MEGPEGVLAGSPYHLHMSLDPETLGNQKKVNMVSTKGPECEENLQKNSRFLLYDHNNVGIGQLSQRESDVTVEVQGEELSCSPRSLSCPGQTSRTTFPPG